MKNISPCLRSLLFLLGLGAVSASSAVAAPPVPKAFHPEYAANQDYHGYLEFFKEVYKTMTENYYHPIEQENLNKFLYVFNAQFYPQFKLSGASENFIKWRSAALLVEALRAPGDIFSAFYPPREATKYETQALGKRLDLGIEGRVTSKGYEVTRMEPRSDAYEKGLREKDVLLKIDRQDVRGLLPQKVQELLSPLEGAQVALEYRGFATGKVKTISPVSREYFKQQVFMVPTGVTGVYCLKLEHFNQKTSEDMTGFLKEILADKNLKGLIIDLRGNPGGPPLAAQEISGFFLKPHDPFAYFQRKNRPPAVLTVPELPAPFRYPGDIVILVDKKSGSASELFSGVLKAEGRAVLMGTNTAGQVFLKSMFHFGDGSMVLLVTARGHYSDGEVFSYDGLTPDVPIEEKGLDLVKYAADYLVHKHNN